MFLCLKNMNDQQKTKLLSIVKQTLVSVVKGNEPGYISCEDKVLNEHCGCFVTLKNHEQLRGCIGQFTADKPLIELVVDMAEASATSDPRFLDHPVTEDELKELDVEISVLSPLKKTNDPLSLRFGVDGIYIVKGRNSGCFLPQVAIEAKWNKEEFLSYCCSHKAGLNPDAWKKPQTEVYLFSADVFGAAFIEISAE